MERNNTYTVLISMHPADRYRYLEELAEFLEAHRCAVRYTPVPDDDAAAALDDVDLVILGVTEKYITWNHSGFVSEAMAALERRVPILPIMLEKGIVNLFNTRCKKLHYVENYEDGITADTLEKIVSHISLLSTAPTDEGKDMPKVFISYRKRDAAELRRLVALIDAHPLRERIRLWYDTNLHPGENYSTTIAAQLKTSDLFLLLVTPSVLEPDNYIARVEYPLARQEKKTVLPIVMRPTDRKALDALFPALPKCITEKQIGGIFGKLNT
ncbi:MAG: toll/interleukin-1 receptor domain-containing protein [Clostridia bacterium]|nr:toll/interleukin-1 receptor domain-containing protein [Clostridia bacterium]